MSADISNETLYTRTVISNLYDTVLTPIAIGLSDKGRPTTVEELAEILQLPARHTNFTNPSNYETIPLTGQAISEVSAKKDYSVTKVEGSCHYQLRRGLRRGHYCTKDPLEGELYCKLHIEKGKAPNTNKSPASSARGGKMVTNGRISPAISSPTSNNGSGNKSTMKVGIYDKDKNLYIEKTRRLVIYQNPANESKVCLFKVDEANNQIPLTPDDRTFLTTARIHIHEESQVTESPPTPVQMPSEVIPSVASPIIPTNVMPISTKTKIVGRPVIPAMPHIPSMGLSAPHRKTPEQP